MSWRSCHRAGLPICTGAVVGAFAFLSFLSFFPLLSSLSLPLSLFLSFCSGVERSELAEENAVKFTAVMIRISAIASGNMRCSLMGLGLMKSPWFDRRPVLCARPPYDWPDGRSYSNAEGQGLLEGA